MFVEKRTISVYTDPMANQGKPMNYGPDDQRHPDQVLRAGLEDANVVPSSTPGATQAEETPWKPSPPRFT